MWYSQCAHCQHREVLNQDETVISACALAEADTGNGRVYMYMYVQVKKILLENYRGSEFS